jgi:ATP-binding cassette, subfamily F, member 3
MSLVKASNLSKSFGADDIFSGLSLSIPDQARIALVGANGIGKTTLLRILIGLDEASSGSLQRARRLTIGYLPQEASLTAEHTLWEECLTVFEDLLAQEAELSRMEAAMADPQRAAQVMERYGELQQDFEHRGGYTYETRIRQTLSGLGFEVEDFERPLWQLSGGQRTRALLARLLLSEPDLLVLDEPTNHLDISAVEWLEGALINWQGSVLLVSHDRYFLDKVVNNVWEMSRAGLETYRGNYSAYLQQRLERWEQRRQIYEAEKERLEKELDYVKRNIAGQRTQQAKGKLRRLSRQVEAIESLGFSQVLNKSWSQVSAVADISAHTMGVAEVERRLRALKGPDQRPASFKINLKAERRSGEIVLRSNDLVVGYPGNPLFSAGDLELRRLECAAIIGPNGSGKTTFLKTILEQVLPISGEIELGASLQVGYFAQAHEELLLERTLVEEIESVTPSMLLADVRSYLGRFLFSGDDVFRQVSTLSGGERGRLALAKLSLMNANLLLLDEPTNHLDIPSQEILQQVLSEFQGTMLLVSHDRYLIDALATQIWEIDPQARRLVVFKGTYSEYHAQQQVARALEVERQRSPQPKNEHRQQSRSNRDERRRQARLQEIEAEIAALEGRLAELAAQLETPPSDPDLVRDLGEDYVLVQDEIHALVVEWESLSVEDIKN